MITMEQIRSVLDHTVYDTNGDKIGDVKHVYLDDATGRPEWLCVKTGLFGTKETFVPTQAADIVADHVEVSLDKNRIKNAPNVDVDAGGHLSAEEERELYRYYDLDWDSSWQQANQPGESGWARAGGERERERLGTGLSDDELRADTGTGRAGPAAGRGEDDAMTRSEERLHVGTESRQTGRARLRKYVVTEDQQVTVPVSREEVRLEREPVTDENLDQALSGPEISEAEHEVTLHAEEPVVEKDTVPVERVRLSKDRVTEERNVSEPIRKEHLDVEEDIESDADRRGRGDTRGPGRSI
ncbi:DUF2382 domain-containing protein [Planomonospora corallina]|uniref:DUF2382 domain-containing protein n=1 Tax=Planomonospora corallina TaxID=1806052 RepID=A0ABV8I704_9ACTN